MKILIALTLALLAANAYGDEGDYLTYDEFVRHLDTGSVKAVTLGRFSEIQGTYLVDGEERPFNSYSRVGSASDPLLIRELRSQNIPVEFAGKEHGLSIWRGMYPTIFFMLAMWGVPLLTLLLVIRISLKVSRIESAHPRTHLYGGSSGTPPPLDR